MQAVEWQTETIHLSTMRLRLWGTLYIKYLCCGGVYKIYRGAHQDHNPNTCICKFKQDNHHGAARRAAATSPVLNLCLAELQIKLVSVNLDIGVFGRTALARRGLSTPFLSELFVWDSNFIFQASENRSPRGCFRVSGRAIAVEKRRTGVGHGVSALVWWPSGSTQRKRSHSLLKAVWG